MTPLIPTTLALLIYLSETARSNFPYRILTPDLNRSCGKDTSKLPNFQTSTLSVSHTSTKLTNSCGTKASFTPSNDTTLYEGQSISFTNTSQNADYYEWYNDVINRTTETDFNNFVPAIGVTQIMLVAHRGTCADTAISYLVRNGTPPTDQKRMITSYGLPKTNEYASGITNAKSDGYLLTGFSISGGFQFPYFVRVSESGCILWSKMLPAVVHFDPGYDIGITIPTIPGSVITTYDSGFVADLTNGNSVGADLIKFDKDGNILWTRDYYYSNDLKGSVVRELSDHSLMILSQPNDLKFALLTSLDENGVFRWQKKYSINNENSGALTELGSKDGLVDRNGSIWFTGKYASSGGASGFGIFPMLFKVDVATGNLIWSKSYSSPNDEYLWSGIHFYKDGLIMNGFVYRDTLIINGVTSDLDYRYVNGWSSFETLLETDLDGNVREGRVIYNGTQLNTVFGDNLIVHEDNSISLFYSGEQLLAVQPGFTDRAYILRLDANKNILWQKQFTAYGICVLKQATPATSKGMAMIGHRINSLQNPFYGFSENMILLKVDSNGKGPDANCDIYNTFNFWQDMPVTAFSPGPVTVTDYNAQVVNYPLNFRNPNSELRYNCPDYLPLCSFMKLSGPNSVCNLKDTFEFIAHKDPSCVDPVKWSYEGSNYKTVFQDGGKTRLIFSEPGTYKIRAEKPFPCTADADSIMVTVAPALVNFSLGGDTVLCTGDSITLRPRGKYSFYRWQDLSVTDSFKVKSPGQYFCLVTDSCGNTKTDSIQIDFRSTIPIELGAPRLKCVSDSLTISPPPGFKQYDWTPKYNLIPSTGGAVVLYPAKDTSYQLVVHDNGGCTGTTELKIKVLPMNAVVLGNDTAVCSGEHVVFSAAGNFQSYAWSNGSVTASIDAQTTGNYSVLVHDQNNCKSSDTVILTVYPLPVVNITGGTVLCQNQNLVLDAGAGFPDYQWQDGSRQQRFTVPDTGYYRVQVTDQYHCSSSDSIHIAQYAESPRKFLPADTAVCLYRGSTLEPKGDFAIYQWSTGETARSILVKTAGIYSLQVVDRQGCRGTDSIQIETKDCEALLVFPNAFTPNHDGLNDIFRLKYPGLVANYQMQIFNRWGQVIFSSSDPFGGWDGNFANELQPPGTYIWIIRYTDRSGKSQRINGSVVLIR